MLILMLFAPQMNIIFAAPQHLKLPHYQQNLCMREVAYLSLIFTRDPSEVKVENAVGQDGYSNPATQGTILAPYPQGYYLHGCQSLCQTQLFVHQ